jgi:phosphosulfolactate synthase
MGKKFLSDIIDVPQRAGKPRKTGLTMVVLDTPWIDGPLPLLRMWAEYIDLVKFPIPCLWVDEEIMVKNIKGYRDLNIDVQIGGVPYELAMMQGKEQECMDKIKALGVNVFEVESHAAELTLEQMKKEVSRLKKAGFRTIGEVGAKWVELDDCRVVQDRINVSRVIQKMQELLEVGAEHVYWEGMVVRALIGNQLDNKAGQKELIEVAKEVGPENIVFEVWDARGHSGNKQIWAWLIHQFGPDVNFGNIDPTEIYMLESVRRGCIYDPAHPFLRWLRRGKPTKNWWDMSLPDYSVDIQKPPVWK